MDCGLSGALSVLMLAAEGAAESSGRHGGSVSLLDGGLAAGEQDPGPGGASAL